MRQDAAFKGVKSWERVYEHTRATIASTDKLQNLIRWNTWYRSNFLQQLMLNGGEVEGTLGTTEQILPASKVANAEQASSRNKGHQSCQGTVYKGHVAVSLQAP